MLLYKYIMDCLSLSDMFSHCGGTMGGTMTILPGLRPFHSGLSRSRTPLSRAQLIETLTATQNSATQVSQPENIIGANKPRGNVNNRTCAVWGEG